MNRLPHLCPTHSLHQTQPRGCVDCQHAKQLAIYDRHIRALESQVEQLTVRLDALELTETSETADTPEVEA
ncbi:MAG TPA: hypothetical protein VFJ06_11235 [Halococcus sp.]|nr:hypothetical protein [Halococcus sp.]